MEKDKAFILWFDQISNDDVGLVGGKNASLGEMYSKLTHLGIKVPNGFAITAYAYRYFIEKAGVMDEIRRQLSKLDISNINSLERVGHNIRELILKAEFPEELKSAIEEAYEHLCKQYGPNTDVAVRSSATAEDLPDASFAGQQETFLNVRGKVALMEACKKCIASLFTDRAISYREDKGFDHFSIALSIGVQKMVRSDKAASGVMFTLDTDSGFRDVVYVTASYGLGENVVKGAVNPDEFYVFKPTLKQGYKPVILKRLGSKRMKLIYSKGGTKSTKNVLVSDRDRARFCVTDEEVLQLAKWGCIIEEHYSNRNQRDTPMDIEWAKDGDTGELFIVQARPETVHSQKNLNVIERYKLKEKGEVLVVGDAVGEKVGIGVTHIIKDVHRIDEFRKGEVLVTEMTDPDWEPIMKMASAIVTNRGGRTCHAAIVSRELGIPCVVGTSDATEKVPNHTLVTVSCCEGEKGYVYKGSLKFDIERVNLEELPKTKTKVMLNVGNPEQAFSLSFLPNDGVGLAREEFIINSYIKVHPLALLNFEKLKNRHLKKEIEEITRGYADKKQFFIDKLAEGIAMIAAAFYPKDVIVRLSDFKSNEYANLIGGELFEPEEENPMIGWRGASRYYSEKYAPAFGLECMAFKKVREEFGLKNVKIMVPFCRTVEEGKRVLAEMEKYGLKRGKDELEVYVMCEIPSNVILAEEFCKIFDGFSIGTNDLTQLTLGLDRDSELVSSIYDERNEAVKRLVAQVIRVAKKNGRKIGICGDAPSTFPEFTEFLVGEGIDSVSVTSDAVLKTILTVAEKEKLLNKS
ncbi:phosphoenolpyruvate synthase [Candidatus Woesearchaeota archaeon]|nr:MAG: phosphoenolpyruvate synthase [Candidatus Woesearchaeota archaeon]